MRSLIIVPLLALSLACGNKSASSSAADAPAGDGADQPSTAPSGSAGGHHAKNAKDHKENDKGDELAKKIAQFVPTPLTADVSGLNDHQRKVLDKLIAASKLMDPIYNRQVWRKNPETRKKLEEDKGEHGKEILAYFEIMRGPWDRQDDWKPFATTEPHPKGAGYYPDGMTESEFKGYVAAHPKEKEALESLTTIVKKEGDKLVAEPYSKAYAEWLVPAAKLLEEAAKESENKPLQRFLRSRAKAFGDDQYRQSDKDWMDLDGRVEVTIGPYETYGDELLGLKAAFESFVTLSDPRESEKLAKYKKLLPEMEANLPIPEGAHGKRGGDSPIRVVDVVFTSGEARGSVQTIAFNLPNDEVVRKEKGAKKVLLKNLIETKFDKIMRPLAAKVMADADLPMLSSEAFFDETLFHELSHSLGPAFVKGSKDKECRVALESSYSAIEEAKADVMGAYNVLFLIKKGEMPKELKDKLLVSYFAGLFRSVRFGTAEAHGKAAALQINRYLEEGAAKQNEKTHKFKVDLGKLEESIGKLAHDLAMVEWEGGKSGAETMLKKYGELPPQIAQLLKDATEVPVDVKPIYPLAGEAP